MLSRPVEQVGLNLKITNFVQRIYNEASLIQHSEF